MDATVAASASDGRQQPEIYSTCRRTRTGRAPSTRATAHRAPLRRSRLTLRMAFRTAHILLRRSRVRPRNQRGRLRVDRALPNLRRPRAGGGRAIERLRVRAESATLLPRAAPGACE